LSAKVNKIEPLSTTPVESEKKEIAPEPKGVRIETQYDYWQNQLKLNEAEKVR